MTALDETETVRVATDSADSYGSKRAWYALIIFEIQILASGIDIAIVTLLVHPIETAFRINDVGFAAITAIPVGVGLAVAYYPTGLLVDTFRRRNILAAGAVIWTLAALIAARADSGAMIFLARLLAGIGTGVQSPAIFSMLSDAFPRTRRASAVGIYWAGYAVGGGIGLTICGALVAATQHNGILRVSGMSLSPWQQCFAACAVMGITVLALVLTVPEPPRAERAEEVHASSVIWSLRTFGQYIRRHGFLWALLFIGGAIYAMGYFAITAWAPAFGMRHYGIKGVSAIAVLGIFSASGALLGSILGGQLAQRGINRGNPRILPRMLIAVAVITCVSAVSFPYMPSWVLAVVGVGVTYGLANLMAMLIMIGIQETASNEVRGQLFGIWGFIAYLPSIVAASVVAFLASGVFAKAGGLGPALAVVGGIASVIAMLLFAFSRGPYERATREMRASVTPPQT